MSELLDRRVSPRISCDFSVNYQARGARAELGRINNIGTAGARLTTQEAIPPVGADLVLHFRLPLSKRPIKAASNVRWVTQGTAGVEFGNLSIRAQDEIWRYYARESARQRGGGGRPAEPSGTGRDHTRIGTTSRLSLNTPGAGLGIAEKVDRGKELRSRNYSAPASISNRPYGECWCGRAC